MALLSRQSLLCLFEYTTVRYVPTHNRKIGLLYRLIQLIVLGYLIGWVFLNTKGYQVKDDTIESSVRTKVKGVARVNTTLTDFWGPEDYLIPEQGGKVFLIITNYIETPSQTLGYCAEISRPHWKPFVICNSLIGGILCTASYDPSVPDSECTTDENCTAGAALRGGNGFMTGNCSESGTCEIYGWCPTEINNQTMSNLVKEAENFTLYVRNLVRFSQFNFSVSNISKNKNNSYLRSCKYDKDPHCPIFRLGDIVSKAGYNFSDVALKGVSIGVMIEWSCDLDKSLDCRPNYSFMNLGSNRPVTATNNIRFARYYYNNTRHRLRALYRVYGIHLEVMVFGSARKFSIIPTIINIASVLTLMTAGSYICDIILLYIRRKNTVHNNENSDRITKKDKEIPFKAMPDGLKRKFSL